MKQTKWISCLFVCFSLWAFKSLFVTHPLLMLAEGSWFFVPFLCCVALRVCSRAICLLSSKWKKSKETYSEKKPPVYMFLNCCPYWQKWACHNISILAGSLRCPCRAVSCSLWEQTLGHKDYMHSFPRVAVYQCLCMCFLYTCTEAIDRKKWNAEKANNLGLE